MGNLHSVHPDAAGNDQRRVPAAIQDEFEQQFGEAAPPTLGELVLELRARGRSDLLEQYMVNAREPGSGPRSKRGGRAAVKGPPTQVRSAHGARQPSTRNVSTAGGNRPHDSARRKRLDATSSHRTIRVEYAVPGQEQSKRALHDGAGASQQATGRRRGGGGTDNGSAAEGRQGGSEYSDTGRAGASTTDKGAILAAAGGFAKQIYANERKKPRQRRASHAGGLYPNLMSESQDDIRNHYDLDGGKMLGAGMSGWVKVVTHTDTGNRFALKTLRLDNVKQSLLTQMKREIDLLRSMQHPNIIRLYDVYGDSEHIYLVMEYCEGGDLYDKLRAQSKGRFAENQVAQMMLKILSAISYMHGEHIAHRDIKLENFVFDTREQNAQIKLIDFGLSKKFKGNEKMHLVAGTSYYCSPEVLRGSYTEACDLWSIGVVCFMLLSGKPPFKGKNDKEILARVKACKYSFRDRVWETISRDARNFIRCLIEPDVSKRWTADMALRHPWIVSARKSNPPRALDSDIISSLQKFKLYSPLKRAALMAVAFQLPQERMQRLRQAFFELDGDMNGFIDLDEMMKHGVDQAVFEAVDMNGNNKIEYVEFIAASIDRGIYMDEAHLRLAFGKLAEDTVVGLAITRDSLADVLGSDYDEEVVNKMLNDGDRSNTGNITFADYVALMKDSPRTDSDYGSGFSNRTSENTSASEAVEAALIRRLSSSVSASHTQSRSRPRSGARPPSASAARGGGVVPVLDMSTKDRARHHPHTLATSSSRMEVEERSRARARADRDLVTVDLDGEPSPGDADIAPASVAAAAAHPRSSFPAAAVASAASAASAAAAAASAAVAAAATTASRVDVDSETKNSEADKASNAVPTSFWHRRLARDDGRTRPAIDRVAVDRARLRGAPTSSDASRRRGPVRGPRAQADDGEGDDLLGDAGAADRMEAAPQPHRTTRQPGTPRQRDTGNRRPHTPREAPHAPHTPRGSVSQALASTDFNGPDASAGLAFPVNHAAVAPAGAGAMARHGSARSRRVPAAAAPPHGRPSSRPSSRSNMASAGAAALGLGRVESGVVRKKDPTKDRPASRRSVLAASGRHFVR